MSWHLKDRDFEEKLNETSRQNHTFSDSLNEIVSRISKEDLESAVGFVVDFHRIGPKGDILTHCQLEISKDEVENIPDYNPYDWNEFPKVTPTEGVVMRVISICGQYAYRECAIFDEGAWKNERDGKPTDFLLGVVKRFRPWSD